MWGYVMDLAARDYLLLLLGALFSVPASVIGAWLAGPLLTLTWSYWLARGLSAVLFWTAPAIFRSGHWQMEWHVDSTRFHPINKSSLALFPFANVIAGEWQAETTDKKLLTYRMIAIHSPSTKLTGRWFDSVGDDLGYVGGMQLIVSPTRNSAQGLWLGFSSDGIVKAGNMILTRTDSPIVQGSD